MSIASQISRIQGEKSRIAIKLSDMGLVESTADLETLADAIEDIPNKGAVNATVRQGEQYTIPAGYHNGSGVVLGLDNEEADASKYMLQQKIVNPNKSVQSVTPDQGYYGLSAVTIGAIPAAYQNVTQVDATAGDVLANKKIVTPDGTVVAGTMPNNGAVSKTLTAGDGSYTIPKGYHDGKGTVAFLPEELNVTPSKQAQTHTPNGTLYVKVNVAKIPDKYIDTSDADAIANNILKNKTAYVGGAKVTGTMENRGNVGTIEIDALSATPVYTILSGYYDSGEVTISDTLENALAAI